jgi:hypothetical protein
MRQFLLSFPAKAGTQEPEGLDLQNSRLAPAWTPASAGEQGER